MEEVKEFRSCHRFARISPQKARYVIDLVRGLPVERALNDLRFSLKRATPMVRNVIKSAIHNATQEAGIEAANLYIARAVVDDGPRIKRWKPRAMGRAYPRIRRTCHISVVLQELKKEDKERAARPRKTAAPEAPAKSKSGTVLNKTEQEKTGPVDTGPEREDEKATD